MRAVGRVMMERQGRAPTTAPSQQRGAARIGGAVDMVQMISISNDK
jgi:hypothetical protein